MHRFSVQLVLLITCVAVACGSAPAMAHPASHAAKVTISAPRYAHPGGTLPVAVRASKAARLTVALSADAKLGAGDVVLTRGLRVRRPKRHASRATARRVLAVPARTAAGRYRLLACVTRRRCVAAARVEVQVAAPSTQDLLAAAVKAHKVSAGRALVLRVWALFGDPRLPAAYRGDAAPAHPDDRALADALAGRAKMTAAQRRQLAPYLLPPNAKGSWLFPGNGAHAVAAAAHDGESKWPCATQQTTQHWGALTGQHVRVWWWRAHPANRNAARALVTAADRTVWPAYQKIMGRTPLPDTGKRCNGGDAKYDIYLLPDDLVGYGTLRGATLPYGPHCTGSPAFTMINTHRGVDPPTRFELAHELFHAFQFAFPYAGDCAAFKAHEWFDEGSAVWASTRVYPHEEGTHGLNDDLLDGGACAPLTTYTYDSFTFVLDVAEHGGAGVVRAAYEKFGELDTLHGLQEALPGGWAKAWKTYAIDSWNQEVNHAPFVGWYGLTRHPDPSPSLACALDGPELPYDPLSLKGHHGYRYLYSLIGRGPLQRRYFSATFAPDVKQVTIHNHTVGSGRSDLQAIEQMQDDSWRIVDLSDRRDTTYCLANHGEDVKTVVFAYDDHSYDSGTGIAGDTPDLSTIPGPANTYDQALTVDVRDSCAHYFNVSAASGTLTYSANYPANRYAGDPCSVTGSETEQWTLDPSQRVGATDGHYDRGSAIVNLPMHVHWTSDWSSSPCQVDGGSGSCHKDVDDTGGPLAMGIAAADAPSLDLQMVATNPPDYICAGAFEDAGVPLDQDVKVISSMVPVASLAGDKPFDVSWSSTVTTAERTLKREMTATLQPVTADGAPLADSSAVQGPLP